MENIDDDDDDGHGHDLTLAWILGSWHVTHSTLPMWRTKRDVCITYTALSSSSAAASASASTDQIIMDDLVTYFPLHRSSTKSKTIHGIDTGSRTGTRSDRLRAWKWRGKGWLSMASSPWEILGFGSVVGPEDDGNRWMVTYFQKTLFTPAGIDIYSRHPAGLAETVLRDIKLELDRLGRSDPEIRRLTVTLFDVARQDADQHQ